MLLLALRRAIKREYGPVLNYFKAFTLFLLVSITGTAIAEDGGIKQVIVIGDSLSAGYRLHPSKAFPAQLQARLRADGLRVRIINAGVSGDTTASGLSRLEWGLADIPGGKPALAIVELGANDALRGVEPRVTRDNLSAILKYFAEAEIPVLLAGMQAPPNMGGPFSEEFGAIYPSLARDFDVALYPFFLDGVAARPHLNLDDGMHPNAEGVAVIVTNIAPLVKELLLKE